MNIRVRHTLDALAADMAEVPVKLITEAPRIIHRNAEEGNKLAQSIARSKSGIHGINYYKRLTVEQIGPYSAEYGPEGIPKTDFVGAGWRHGGPNMDLPNSADVIAPKFADAIGDMAAELYW